MGKKLIGFTLIEILVVIGVLAVLLAIVLVAINPVEQLNKASDSRVQNSISQLGSSTTAYYASHQAFPTVDTTWTSDLITSADLSDRPISPKSTCSPSLANDTNYCLQTASAVAVVYARLSSNNMNDKCIGSDVAYFTYDTSRGRACIVCDLATATISPQTACDFD